MRYKLDLVIAIILNNIKPHGVFYNVLDKIDLTYS